MNQNSLFFGSRSSFFKTLPPAVKALLLINVGSFFIGQLWGPPQFDYIFGLTVPSVFLRFQLYQFVTYLFVHGGLVHLLFNMLILYIFGRELEIYWGTPFFLRYYFISGIGAGICSLPFIWGAGVPMIGASGALFGLLIAYGMLFPDRIITLLLFFVFPVRMKARIMVMIFIVLELFFLLSRGRGGGVAHFAHLGGALVGFIYLKAPVLLKRRKRSPSGDTRLDSKERFQDELNRVLDKLAREGWRGLTAHEKDFLHEAKNHLLKND